MIEYVDGNICSVKEGIIIHGCNCLGVMGSGVAYALHKKFPEIYAEYRTLCLDNLEKPEKLLGRICVVKPKDTTNLYVINAFTQTNYGKDNRKYVSYDAIDKSFFNIMNWKKVNEPNLTIHFPMIGSGLGGGSWKVIETIINNRLGDEKGICITLRDR
jgi:O-acetyl-ADP-ribose deacetylase (regulator of RNase III)